MAVAGSGDLTQVDRAVGRLFTAEKNTRLRELRALFVENLDFEQSTGAIPVPPIGEMRFQPAQLIASRDGVQVVYSEAPSDSVLASEALRKLYKVSNDKLGEILLVCSTVSGGNWQFVYPRQQGGREVLRRLSVQKGQPRRTFIEQLAGLVSGIASKGVRSALEQLYDVEAVTSEFFKTYKRVFDTVLASIEGFPDPEERRLFCQTLFNRLMFLYFLQRKGCLTFGGSTNYLNALWDDQKTSGEGNFYATRLDLLFFTALANERDANYPAVRPAIEQLIGRVPFLNGGLFAKDALDARPGVHVPNTAFELIINDLFDRFNFTITESTPYDVEVAVDPEMLGKVFEELVTGRHESGSYYTPRPIVAFMGHEALKGYLAHQLPGEAQGAIEAFVEEHDPAGLQNAEAVLAALKRVRICDPACGSGAYLLGMLQELLALRTALFASRKVGAKHVYDRKLEIIQENLYGVDIDQFAVNIARLRLWLSLIVDFDGPEPPPLPNLDFKIECGDSLSAPSPEGPAEYAARDMVIRDFREAKARYAVAHGEEKAAERREVERLQGEVAIWTHPGQAQVAGVDWAVAFAEVFADGGFDIVLANPPYVRQELIAALKPALKKVFPEIYRGVSDLYCYFYARAIQLLKVGGILAFISPNKWFRATYGKGLRSHLAVTCQVLNIIDFGDLPVFASATTYAMIFVAQKQKISGRPSIYTQVTSLRPPFPDILALVKTSGQELPASAIAGDSWLLTDAASARRLERMGEVGTPLGTYVKNQIYRGVVTGRNSAFWVSSSVRNKLIAKDPSCAEIIKPLLVGDNVRRWHIDYEEKWLLFTRRGVNIENYPSIQMHLEHFRNVLEPKPKNWPATAEWSGRKPGSYRWYEIQDEVSYHTYFERPKIIFPDLALLPRFSLDTTGAYADCTLNVIPVRDLFLLGVLNSTVTAWYLKQTSAEVRGGYLRFKPQYVERVPVPPATSADREAIEILVQHCLAENKNRASVAELEAEIDERLALLFHLTTNEVSEMKSELSENA